MNITEYKTSLQQSTAPSSLSKPLQALWYAAKNDWNKAHELIQDEPDAASAWVHAYLHRVEGDEFNTRYWYNRANQAVSNESFDREWEKIASTLI